MIAKGNLHSHGGKLAAYMTTGKKGEIAELVELRGFASGDIRTAFHDVEVQAQGTHATKPFFHAYTRLVAGEELTREQWLQVADRQEKTLGLTGQPRAVSFHRDRESGEMHMHVAWSRIDAERGRAIDPGLYKNKLKELCRTLENQLDLTKVRNERAPEDKALAAGRDEFEQARRLNTDLKAIRNGIRECWERSDSGKSFAAALDANGLILARGDRRDFVVIDAAGGEHALGKRITGATAAETRRRLADLDRAQLPDVEEAKTRQHVRDAARAARRHPDPAAERQAPEPAPSPQKRPDPGGVRSLGKTASDIRAAWNQTHTAGDLMTALKGRGITLARVTPDDAHRSERTAAAAREAGRFARVLRDNEIVAVDGRGDVYGLDQRTTGDLPGEIRQRLAGVDRDSLSSVSEAREAMREASRAAWIDRKQSELPLTAIEQTIAAAYGETRDGKEFSAALDQAGIGLARVTTADVQALDALRRNGQIAFAVNPAHRVQYFPPVRDGELVAVDRFGGVHRLNPGRADAGGIEQRISEAQPQMASVVDVRAAFELVREHRAAFREEIGAAFAQQRADHSAARAASAEAKETIREMHDTVRTAERGVSAAVADAGVAVDKGRRAAGSVLGGVAEAAEKLIDFIGDFLAPPPPLSPDQAERAERTAESRREERAAATAAHNAAEEERRFQQIMQQAAHEEEKQRERDDDRGRSR